MAIDCVGGARVEMLEMLDMPVRVQYRGKRAGQCKQESRRKRSCNKTRRCNAEGKVRWCGYEEEELEKGERALSIARRGERCDERSC
jgi:hypothetical protein